MKSVNVSPLLIFFIMLLIPGHVIAQPRENIVLLPIEVSPEYANQKDLLGGALQQSLSQKYNVFYGSKVEEALEAEYAKDVCTAESCVQNIAIIFNGEIVVDASVQLVEESTFLRVQFQNVITGELEAIVQDSCRECSFTQLIDFIDERASDIAFNSSQGLTALLEKQSEPVKPLVATPQREQAKPSVTVSQEPINPRPKPTNSQPKVASPSYWKWGLGALVLGAAGGGGGGGSGGSGSTNSDSVTTPWDISNGNDLDSDGYTEVETLAGLTQSSNASFELIYEGEDADLIGGSPENHTIGSIIVASFGSGEEQNIGVSGSNLGKFAGKRDIVPKLRVDGGNNPYVRLQDKDGNEIAEEDNVGSGSGIWDSNEWNGNALKFENNPTDTDRFFILLNDYRSGDDHPDNLIYGMYGNYDSSTNSLSFDSIFCCNYSSLQQRAQMQTVDATFEGKSIGIYVNNSGTGEGYWETRSDITINLDGAGGGSFVSENTEIAEWDALNSTVTHTAISELNFNATMQVNSPEDGRLIIGSISFSDSSIFDNLRTGSTQGGAHFFGHEMEDIGGSWALIDEAGALVDHAYMGAFGTTRED